MARKMKGSTFLTKYYANFTAGQFAMPHFFLCKGQRLRLYIGVSGQSQ